MHSTVLIFVFVIFISSVRSDNYEGDYYKIGNDVLNRAIDAAIAEMLRLNTTDKNSFAQIFERVFGTEISIPIPSVYSCRNEVYPLHDIGVLSYILKNKEIVYGASSITRPPKIYDCTPTSKERKGRKLYKCNGFEAEVGQAVMNLLSKHYLGEEVIKSYFVEVKWNYNATDNMLYHLDNNVYDAIISGMSVDGEWTLPNGATIDRNTIFKFSCPYQIGGSAIVGGKKELPEGLAVINSLQSLNHTDIYTCVDYGTSMAHHLEDVLTRGTIVYCGVNGTESSDCRKWTNEGTKCHVYIAPILNALYDEKVHENLTIKYIFEEDSTPVGIAMRYDYVDFAVSNTPCVLIIIALLIFLIA